MPSRSGALEWLDDPRIRRALTYQGKKVGGEHTRRSFAAQKLSEYLVQTHNRMRDLRDLNAEISRLTAQHEQMSQLVSNREAMFRELNQRIRSMEQEAFSQRPDTDRDLLARQSAEMTAEFSTRLKYASEHIDAIRQAINSKKSTARRHEDRIEFYRKRVRLVLIEADAA